MELGILLSQLILEVHNWLSSVNGKEAAKRISWVKKLDASQGFPKWLREAKRCFKREDVEATINLLVIVYYICSALFMSYGCCIHHSQIFFSITGESKLLLFPPFQSNQRQLPSLVVNNQFFNFLFPPTWILWVNPSSFISTVLFVKDVKHHVHGLDDL